MDFPFIQSVRPAGLLSFPDDTPPLALGRLNLLIGPNASGKSNLLDVFDLLRAAPFDIQDSVRLGGGARNWIWRDHQSKTAQLDVTTNISGHEFSHRFQFLDFELKLMPVQEQIRHLPDTLIFESLAGSATSKLLRQKGPNELPAELAAYSNFDAATRETALQLWRLDNKHGEIVEIDSETPGDQSVLAKFRSPIDYPQLNALAGVYGTIRKFSEWSFGRGNPIRKPQPADGRGDFLDSDSTNLGMVLSKLGTDPEAKQLIVDGMRELYEGFTDIETVVESGTVRIFFTERGRRSIPAVRLSDGALRYLYLLTILYGPDVGTIDCIEEPELGLHPDIVATLGKHLRQASERKQLIVTTHSDTIVDSLSDVPEAVITFENDGSGTRMLRLDAADLQKWLSEYRLGELWTSGQIGGTRW